jgi:adenylosuccinate lyase|tara:strand:+ start:111 stop:449 length:339 start_codon:yes stop_codon:yes gene_type:complete
MLKNPKKADLDKDGKLSSYEKKRGMAVEKNMNAKTGKMMKAALGVAALASKKGREKAKKIMKGKTKLSPAMNYLGRDMGGEIKGYGQARSKGMGLQDESVPMKDNSYIKDLI